MNAQINDTQKPWALKFQGLDVEVEDKMRLELLLRLIEATSDDAALQSRGVELLLKGVSRARRARMVDALEGLKD